MSSNSSDYSPIAMVQAMHAIVRRKNGGEEVSNDFNITFENINPFEETDYLDGVAYVPGILFYVELFCLFLLLIVLSCRCCIRCCRCSPGYDTEQLQKASEMRDYFNSTKILSTVFWGTVIIIIVANQIVFGGRWNVDQAYDKGVDAIDFFQDTFVQLNNDGLSLQYEGALILDDAESAANGACPSANVVLPYVNEFNNDVNQYVDMISPMSGEISDIDDTFKTIYNAISSYTFWFFYGVVYILVLPFVIGVKQQSKCLLQMSIVWVSLILIAFFAVCFAEFAVLITLSDFCMSPTNNTLPLIPSGSQEDVISYYITCIGENPYGEYLEGAYNATYDLNKTVNVLLSTSCPDNTDLLNIRGNLTNVVYDLDNITLSSACPPFQQQADTILNTAICNDFFMGTFLIWVSQYVVSGSILILLIVSSTIYYYFGRYWNMDKDDLNNMVARLVENGGSEGGSNANPAQGTASTTANNTNGGYATEVSVPGAVSYGSEMQTNPIVAPMATVVTIENRAPLSDMESGDPRDDSSHSEIGLSPIGSRSNTNTE